MGSEVVERSLPYHHLCKQSFMSCKTKKVQINSTKWHFSLIFRSVTCPAVRTLSKAWAWPSRRPPGTTPVTTSARLTTASEPPPRPTSPSMFSVSVLNLVKIWKHHSLVAIMGSPMFMWTLSQHNRRFPSQSVSTRIDLCLNF